MTDDQITTLGAEATESLLNASALLDPIRMKAWDNDGLTVTQLRVLGHLLEREGLSNAELAERLFVTRPSVSALLERLERGGFIRREVSPNDRRGICIWLEPRGRLAISSFRSEIRDYTDRLMAGMTQDEVQAFRTAVERFVEVGRARRAKDLASEHSDE